MKEYFNMVVDILIALQERSPLKYSIFFFFFFFFNCYLADPRPTLGHSRGDSLTNPMLIAAFYLIRPEGHREPRSEVGSLSPAERLYAMLLQFLQSLWFVKKRSVFSSFRVLLMYCLGKRD